MEHVIPLNDTYEHEESPLCTCIPQERYEGVLVHNSYDSREVGHVVMSALDCLALALTEHGHQWSEEQRVAYEHATDLIQAHFPEVGILR